MATVSPAATRHTHRSPHQQAAGDRPDRDRQAARGTVSGLASPRTHSSWVRRTAWWSTAILAAVGVVHVAVTLPPPARSLQGHIPIGDVAGGYHVHTVRSDGSGTVDEVAAAAARAGLSFIIVTDHGDARRALDPPAYKAGVLVIDAVEVGTTGGHIVALGLTSRAPYPLGGSPHDVLDDIHRLGGSAIIAHPDSASVGLSYRGPESGFDGLEWLNLDSEWRDKSPGTLFEAALHYLIRPPESVASLLRRPAKTLARWDAAARTRPVFGLAALDAHARIGWRARVEPRTGAGIDRPTYEAMFRSLAQVVVLDAPLSGDAAADASRVLDAIRRGRSYSIVRGLASPASLTFTARRGNAVVTMGSRLEVSADETAFRAAVSAGPVAQVVLLRDGRAIASGQGAVEYTDPRAAGVYRIEAWLPDTRVPWIVSNPITVAPSSESSNAPDTGMEEATSMSLETTAWRLEHEASSVGRLRADAGALRFDFQLGPGRPSGQFAALATSLPTDRAATRIAFTARADQPLRMSIEVRRPAKAGGQRWSRSVFVDQTSREFAVPLSEFEPAEAVDAGLPPAADVDSLLFVVDTVNTLPGTPGTIWLSNVALRRRVDRR
jgi:hypothetical protein